MVGKLKKICFFFFLLGEVEYRSIKRKGTEERSNIDEAAMILV